MNCRAVVAAVLVTLLALEILPCAFAPEPVLTPSGTSGFACRFEPLQVCDDGDVFLGGLADLPLLVPATAAISPFPEALALADETERALPEGFAPAIDRPPRPAT